MSQTGFEKLTIAVIVAAASALAGCGSTPDATATENTDSRLQALVCGTYTKTRPDGTLNTYPELYVVTTMNRKLRLHPDFAAFVGLQSVGTCDEARTFMNGFVAYSEKSPGVFDDPVDLTPPPVPPPPPGAPPDFSSTLVPKIMVGDMPGDPNVVRQSIVLIQHRIPDPDPNKIIIGGCTATFIARNWILTSAHCMGAAADAPTGVDGRPIPFQGYNQFQVRIHTSSGDSQIKSGDPDHPNLLWAYQYPSLDFVGTNSLVTAGTDIALLFLYPPWYDPFLPPHPDTGAMRILLNPPNVGDEFFAWGWSPNNQGDPQVLRESQIPAVISQVIPSAFEVVAMSPNDVRTCDGDSGGPATQSIGLSFGSRDATFGVHSNKSGSSSNLCAPEGSEEDWARIDAAMPFIETTMNSWNGPAFSCARYPLAGGFGNYARCWGTECEDDSDCAPEGKVCAGLNPAAGVLFGQCLPPNPTRPL